MAGTQHKDCCRLLITPNDTVYAIVFDPTALSIPFSKNVIPRADTKSTKRNPPAQRANFLKIIFELACVVVVVIDVELRLKRERSSSLVKAGNKSFGM